jgi:hypothetical protein
MIGKSKHCRIGFIEQGKQPRNEKHPFVGIVPSEENASPAYTCDERRKDIARSNFSGLKHAIQHPVEKCIPPGNLKSDLVVGLGLRSMHFLRDEERIEIIEIHWRCIPGTELQARCCGRIK